MPLEPNNAVEKLPKKSTWELLLPIVILLLIGFESIRTTRLQAEIEKVRDESLTHTLADQEQIKKILEVLMKEQDTRNKMQNTDENLIQAIKDIHAVLRLR